MMKGSISSHVQMISAIWFISTDPYGFYLMWINFFLHGQIFAKKDVSFFFLLMIVIISDSRCIWNPNNKVNFELKIFVFAKWREFLISRDSIASGKKKAATTTTTLKHFTAINREGETGFNAFSFLNAVMYFWIPFPFYFPIF